MRHLLSRDLKVAHVLGNKIHTARIAHRRRGRPFLPKDQPRDLLHDRDTIVLEVETLDGLHGLPLHALVDKSRPVHAGVVEQGLVILPEILKVRNVVLHLLAVNADAESFERYRLGIKASLSNNLLGHRQDVGQRFVGVVIQLREGCDASTDKIVIQLREVCDASTIRDVGHERFCDRQLVQRLLIIAAHVSQTMGR